MTRYRQSEKSRQRGAILITSLILLLVLTLISISGVNLSFLENLMAGNTQFQVSALADAEMALRAGELDVEGIVTDGNTLDFGTNDQYYLNGTIDPSLRTWGFTSAVSSNNGNDSNYVVEYIGQRSIPAESTEHGVAIAGTFAYLFLVDAQNVSGKGATRNVQTVYVTSTAP